MSNKLLSHFQQQLNIDVNMSDHDKQLAESFFPSTPNRGHPNPVQAHLRPANSLPRQKKNEEHMTIAEIQSEIVANQQLLDDQELVSKLPDGGKRIKDKITQLSLKLETAKNSLQDDLPIQNMDDLAIQTPTISEKFVSKETQHFVSDPTIVMATARRSGATGTAKLISLKESLQLEANYKKDRDEIKLANKLTLPIVQEMVQDDVSSSRYREFDELMDDMENTMDDS